MKDLNVNIISTEMDLKLFTDHKYHNRIYHVLQSVRQKYHITEQYAIACYRNCVKVYDSKRNLVTIEELVI